MKPSQFRLLVLSLTGGARGGTSEAATKTRTDTRASTPQVGCATALCTKSSPFGARLPKWQLWVCDYTPPGNYVGRKPY